MTSNSANNDGVKVNNLDARHLLCPMPVIKVQKLIEELGPEANGQHLAVVCTDPGTLYDIPAWSKVHGHTVLDKREEDNEYHILIEICLDDA